tara:strand:- start:4674 stop:5057 length:384 start_codon:yes stop_codon:yes gene_type:complete
MDFSNNVSDNDDLDDLTFVSARKAMKEDGRFEFAFSAVVYNDEKEVITLIDSNTSTACAVWIQPYPDAQYEVSPDQTDGARLGRAIARAFSGDSNDEIFAKANESGGILTVEKNPDYNNAWLWSVKV